MEIFMDKQTEKKWTNVGVGDENVDRQTDVRHINLIGALVTHNPPKNMTRSVYPHIWVKYVA